MGVGSNIGGIMTLIGLSMILFTLNNQFNDMLSGRHDLVNSIRSTNHFEVPND
jgi:hypothetical protein